LFSMLKKWYRYMLTVCSVTEKKMPLVLVGFQMVYSLSRCYYIFLLIYKPWRVS
jgi:hypothetical protein